MRRRHFLLASAASLVAAPAAADAERENLKMWFAYDFSGVEKCVVLSYRIHDQKIYVEKTEDFTADEIRYRWRAAAPEIARWWGTHGR